jgi:hypothetical protein
MSRPQQKPAPQPAPAGLKIVEKPPQGHAARHEQPAPPEPKPEAAAAAVSRAKARQKLHPARIWPD